MLLEVTIIVPVLAGIIDVAGEAGAKVIVVAGAVGHEVVAPIIPHVPVRIGKAVGDVGIKFGRQRLIAIDAAIIAVNWAVRGLGVRAIERALLEVEAPPGSKTKLLSEWCVSATPMPSRTRSE